MSESFADDQFEEMSPVAHEEDDEEQTGHALQNSPDLTISESVPVSERITHEQSEETAPIAHQEDVSIEMPELESEETVLDASNENAPQEPESVPLSDIGKEHADDTAPDGTVEPVEEPEYEISKDSTTPEQPVEEILDMEDEHVNEDIEEPFEWTDIENKEDPVEQVVEESVNVAVEIPASEEPSDVEHLNEQHENQDGDELIEEPKDERSEGLEDTTEDNAKEPVQISDSESPVGPIEHANDEQPTKEIEEPVDIRDDEALDSAEDVMPHTSEASTEIPSSQFLEDVEHADEPLQKDIPILVDEPIDSQMEESPEDLTEHTIDHIVNDPIKIPSSYLDTEHVDHVEEQEDDEETDIPVKDKIENVDEAPEITAGLEFDELSPEVVDEPTKDENLEGIIESEELKTHLGEESDEYLAENPVNENTDESADAPALEGRHIFETEDNVEMAEHEPETAPPYIDEAKDDSGEQIETAVKHPIEMEFGKLDYEYLNSLNLLTIVPSMSQNILMRDRRLQLSTDMRMMHLKTISTMARLDPNMSKNPSSIRVK
jgi:hypothetical protein